ncbi:STAS domain-containing protein [Fictibacillus sp. KU28468]|uniref:STAS domain-containing protein n=1 Tax=Fictibacillus sp. KU28468 TaxID=2991053 RepID=UPI00223CC248|nr:STAS domain-containing protein [Fictibacillus sp. KU28468]UZJ79292.1 STAS domain-containing protein [Fictibacillus sp. KU28468]
MVIEKQLYAFMLDHSHHMAEDWLQSRATEEYYIYSLNASREIGSTLRKQHIKFTTMLADCMMSGHDPYPWAKELAQQRKSAGVPLIKILQNFNRCREISWRYIQQFADSYAEDVRTSHIGAWSLQFNRAFDRVIEVFTSHYHQFDDGVTFEHRNMIQTGVPVIPITGNIGILPLVGELDTFRATFIQEQTLNKASSLKLQYLIIDLSGVYTLDTTVADELFTVIKQLSLLGIKAIISGIRPEIAQTSIKLGLNFSDILTFGSLKVALAHLLEPKKKVKI